MSRPPIFGYIGLLLFLGANNMVEAKSVFGDLPPEQVKQWVQKEILMISQKPQELSQERKQWGEKQLKQMLKDRPAMAGYVTQGDDLWDWTAAQFAGQTSGIEGKWDNGNPEPLWDAATSFLPKDPRFNIFVTNKFTGPWTLAHHCPQLNGTPKPGDMLWYQAIFELFNSQKLSRFLKVVQRGMLGEINREEFILEIDTVEEDTRTQATNFYFNSFIPHCQKKSLPYRDGILDEFVRAGQKAVALPEDRINDLFIKKENDDHYQYFGFLYDSSILPCLSKKSVSTQVE
jgi:hypothetical protein